MDKGFVYFNDSKIPFVIENYRMELFTDEPILNDFAKNTTSRITLYFWDNVLTTAVLEEKQHF